MNNHIFIKYLDDLSKNRFALNHLQSSEFYQFYQQVLQQFPTQPSPDDWCLIGTDGCHLCDHAKDIITQASLQTALPKLQQLDLADIKDSSSPLIDTFGVMIPILLTPTRLLCYPFGVMDVLALQP